MPRRSRTSMRRTFCVALVVVTVALSSCSGSGSGPDDDAGVAANALALPDLSDAIVDIRSATPDPAGPPAATPEAAVAQFVDAEGAGDYARSFDILATADRAELPTREAWIRAHGYLPQVKAFTQDSITTIDGDAATVGGIVELVPSLDDVRGLVPASGRASWSAVSEDGGWRLSYAASRIDLRYPEPPGATEAVETWAAARQRCDEPAADLELTSGMLGVTALIDELCGAEGAAEVGDAVELGDRAEADAVISSYGPAADKWARVVALEEPVAMDVVLAPIATGWVVIGVLGPR